MIDNFKVSYMQLDLVWEDPDANIAKIEEHEFRGRKMKFKQKEATALMARKPRDGWGKAYKMS